MTRELNKLLKLVGKDEEVHLVLSPSHINDNFRNRVIVLELYTGYCIQEAYGPTMSIAIKRAIKMFKEKI